VEKQLVDRNATEARKPAIITGNGGWWFLVITSMHARPSKPAVGVGVVFRASRIHGAFS
jgi:hypothetical protein